MSISEEVKKSLQKSVRNEVLKMLGSVKNKSNTFTKTYKEYLTACITLIDKGIFSYAKTFEVNFDLIFGDDSRGIIIRGGEKEAKEVSDWLQSILNSSNVNIYKSVKVTPTNTFCKFTLNVIM